MVRYSMAKLPRLAAESAVLSSIPEVIGFTLDLSRWEASDGGEQELEILAPAPKLRSRDIVFVTVFYSTVCPI